MAVILTLLTTFRDTMASEVEVTQEIKFKLFLYEYMKPEFKGPMVNIKVSSIKNYSCANFTYEYEVTTEGNTITVDIRDVIEPEICLTAMGPASFAESFDLKNGVYQIEFRAFSSIEKFILRVGDEYIALEQVAGSLMKIADQNKFIEKYRLLRTPKNLITVQCFRYQYGCEGPYDQEDELCPLLYRNLSEVALPLTKSSFMDDQHYLGGLLLSCVEGDHDGECRIFSYDGKTSDLEALLHEADNYDLRNGHFAKCRPDSGLYYKIIRTWNGHTFCC